MRTVRLLALAIAALSFSSIQAQIVVNEVCASNMNTYADNYGEFEDWFELYNTTGAAVDISGWWVSNRAGNPLKWQVPAGTTIPAGGRQVFICSKRDQVVGAFEKVLRSRRMNRARRHTLRRHEPRGRLNSA